MHAGIRFPSPFDSGGMRKRWKGTLAVFATMTDEISESVFSREVHWDVAVKILSNVRGKLITWLRNTKQILARIVAENKLAIKTRENSTG